MNPILMWGLTFIIIMLFVIWLYAWQIMWENQTYKRYCTKWNQQEYIYAKLQWQNICIGNWDYNIIRF